MKGGETVFFEPMLENQTGGLTINEEIELNQGIDKYKITRVKPKAGHGILFDHTFLHEGSRIQEGTKYIIRTDIVFKLLARDEKNPTILERLKYKSSLNFFRDAQFLELQGEKERSSEMYQRSRSHKIHNIPMNDLWYLIIEYMKLKEIIQLMKTCKKIKNIISSSRSSYWNKICKINQPIRAPWIPRVITKKGCRTKFKFHDNKFFESNISGCLRVVCLYTLYLFTNKLMATGSYIGRYDCLTGIITRCDLTNLLTSAFYELPCMGLPGNQKSKFFNLYKRDIICHENLKNIGSVNNIDQRYIEPGPRPDGFSFGSHSVDHNLLEIENYDKYLECLSVKNGCAQFEKIYDAEVIERCTSRSCYTDNSIHHAHREVTICTNNLIFDFSKQKLNINDCNDTSCEYCNNLSSLRGKGYVVNFQDLNIPSHMHAACSHYYTIKSTSNHRYIFIGSKYINSLHIFVTSGKKPNIETYYEGYF